MTLSLEELARLTCEYEATAMTGDILPAETSVRGALEEKTIEESEKI